MMFPDNAQRFVERGGQPQSVCLYIELKYIAFALKFGLVGLVDNALLYIELGVPEWMLT